MYVRSKCLVVEFLEADNDSTTKSDELLIHHLHPYVFPVRFADGGLRESERQILDDVRPATRLEIWMIQLLGVKRPCFHPSLQNLSIGFLKERLCLVLGHGVGQIGRSDRIVNRNLQNIRLIIPFIIPIANAIMLSHLQHHSFVLRLAISPEYVCNESVPDGCRSARISPGLL